MKDSITHIGLALKEAREKKGLSQRALSAKTKVPQSHLSKIERGEVDIQTSTLIEIARVLDLEPMLVPRRLVPTFKALLRGSQNTRKQTPLYSLEQDGEEKEDV